MLEQAMIEQLKEVFTKLENQITLKYYQSEHAKQKDLLEMLRQVESTSDNIQLEELSETSNYPRFKIAHNGKDNGIAFSGIPGGHEFTSLILAILNSDKKGKLPDDLILHRFKSLKGPIHLRTYISLSCENCPLVVQSLNLMAVYNENFSHEMVDGEFVQDEIEKLNIQGVPSVIHDDELLSSGKMGLIDLLEKLESKFGVEESGDTPVAKDLGQYDVVVVGAGPAGASSAIYTARKGLKTAIITDRLGGQLQDTKGIENMISVPYTEGPQLTNNIFQHVREYPIEILEHRRVNKVEPGKFKKLELNSGETLETRALIVATGAQWRELKVPGEKDYLGRGVAFCPHCDGPYYKGKDIAIVGGGNSGVEAAIDLAGIVKHITVIEYNPELKADQVLIDKLKSLDNVSILTNARTSEIVGDGDKVNKLVYEDRESGDSKDLPLDGVFVQIGLVPNSQFLGDVVDKNKFGEIEIDNKCRTSQEGIYAAGDVTTVPFKQIVIAMGEGAKAGLTAFEDQML